MPTIETVAPPKRPTWYALHGALILLVSLQVWRIHDLFPILAIPGFPVVCTLVAVLALCLDRDPQRRLLGLNQPVVRASFGILLLVAVSIPGSLWPGYSASFLLKEYLRCVILMVLVAASVRGMADLRRLTWLQFAGVTLLCAVALVRAESDSEGRLTAVPYFNANDLAAVIACTLPLVIFLWRPAGLVVRLLLAACTVLAMMALGQTGSRGAFLAFVAVAGYWLLVSRGIAPWKRVGAVALLVILLVTFANDRYFDRMRTIFQPSADYNWSGRSATGRMEIWRRGVGYMLRHPIVGVGAGTFPLAEGTLAREARVLRQYGKQFKWSAAHNSFIQIGAEIGVFGLILFVALLIGAYRSLSRVRRRGAGEPALLAHTLTASLIGFIVTAVFSSQAYSAYLYTLLGMVLGLSRLTSHVPAPALSARPFLARSVPGPQFWTGGLPLSSGPNRGAR